MLYLEAHFGVMVHGAKDTYELQLCIERSSEALDHASKMVDDALSEGRGTAANLIHGKERRLSFQLMV